MSEPKHPLQSKQWADFRAAWGNEILKTKYGYITLHKLPFGNKKIGMFIRGPKPTSKMLSDLQKIGKENNLIFIKLEPFMPTVIARSDSDEAISKPDRHATLAMTKTTSLLKNNNCVPGKTLFTPSSFWIDLSKSEKELLAGFHSKTRYNIRYAQRHGVTVEIDPPQASASRRLGNSNKAFEKYLELMRETVERQRFYAHSEKYHRLMWKYLHTKPKQKIANLLVAKKDDEVLTAWIVFNYDKFLYYPYGASSMKHKNLQANSLMMWEAIKFGKRHKCQTFDLWGRETGKGFTKFKEGFNPEVVEFIGTWDLVIDKNYYQIYKIMEKLRWIVLRTKSKFVRPNF